MKPHLLSFLFIVGMLLWDAPEVCPEYYKVYYSTNVPFQWKLWAIVNDTQCSALSAVTNYPRVYFTVSAVRGPYEVYAWPPSTKRQPNAP